MQTDCQRTDFVWRSIALLIVLAAFNQSANALAQGPSGTADPTGIEAALKIESALVKAIAKAEASVVAIARIRRGDEPKQAPRIPNLPGFPREMFRRDPEPTDPTFVPHEYGTGVVVDSKGLILTAYHVVGEPQHFEYYVWSAKKPQPATVLAADPWLDLAVLQVSVGDLPAIEFGEAKNLRRGQIVVALGNPFAIARDGTASSSWGIVSNLNRAAPPNREGTGPEKDNFHHFGTLIQTDAKLNFGTSGGALINLQGQMIGLTTSLTALTGIDTAAGFAIPVDNDFRKSVDLLKKGTAPSYGFLGVEPETRPLAERQAGKLGVAINEVFAATPAAMAGLRHRDVITHVDEFPIHDADSLIRHVGGKTVGSTVDLTIERPGLVGRSKPFKVNVSLVKKYLATSRRAISSVPEATWRGLRVEHSTAVPNFRQSSSLLAGNPCVAVVHVDTDSQAWRAGLRSGDFITHVGSIRVSTPEGFYDLVRDEPAEVVVRLLNAEPDRATRTVSP